MKLEFHGITVTLVAGWLAHREPDEAPGPTGTPEPEFYDSPRDANTPYSIAACPESRAPAGWQFKETHSSPEHPPITRNFTESVCTFRSLISMVMTGGGIVAATEQSQRQRQGQDNLLVERLTQGERSGFDEIVTRHQKWVARLAYRLLGWPDDVEDVVQEVFLAVLKNLAQFRGQGSLKTWLTAITVNTCRSWRRRKIVRLKYLRRARARTPLDLTEDGEPSLDAETVARVRRTIQKLPTGSREVIVLRYLEDLPIQEVAQVLHISRNAVNLRLNRARARLREKLADLIEE